MIGALLLVAPGPSPSPTDVTIDGTPLGSPGFLGFVFTFALAIAALFLFLSLTRHMLVVDRRARALGLHEDEQGPDPDGGSDGAAWDLPRDDEPRPDERPGTP